MEILTMVHPDTRTPRAQSPYPSGQSAELLERSDLTPTLAWFRLRVGASFPAFRPGQYVTLGLPQESGSLVWRPYSIASEPEQLPELELIIRRALDPVPGVFTSRLWQLQPGARVYWKRPKGHFLDDLFDHESTDDRTALLLASGTGLAPFLSAARTLRRTGWPRRVVLCHGASLRSDLAARAELAGWENASGGRLRYLPTISRPGHLSNADWSGEVGRVERFLDVGPDGNRATLEDALGKPLQASFISAYACGFRGTIDAVTAALTPLGFRGRREAGPDGLFDLHAESFG